jgi:hypothetical protein
MLGRLLSVVGRLSLLLGAYPRRRRKQTRSKAEPVTRQAWVIFAPRTCFSRGRGWPLSGDRLTVTSARLARHFGRASSPHAVVAELVDALA